MLLMTPRDVAGNATTRLTFETVTERAAGIVNIQPLAVPVVGYAIVVALLYIGGGVLGLIPVKQSNLRRLKLGWLILNGVLIIPTVLILAAAGKSTNLTTMVAATFQLATPIVIGALAGIWCERSGVVNIAIEGMMLTGAAFGFVTFSLLFPLMGTKQAQFWGVIIAVASGGIMALLHAWLCITFRTDQIVSGVVINILALGVTSFIRREVLLSSEAGRETLQQIRIPALADIPVVGEVLFNGRPIFYCMIILLFVTHIVLYYTRWGLRTRAVGENPHAADTLGINVIRNRWINVFIGGLIAGLAGAWFSLETVGGFDDNMTSGRGFIALAAMIFGKWTPFGAAAGGLLFGFASALDTRFQILGVAVPPQFVQMTPYVVTMIVLAGLVGRAVAPKADGIPYSKE
jgi:simple sugar transport system permease protein